MTNVLLEKKGNIAVATINRPKALNALNSQVLEDLNELVELVKAGFETLVDAGYPPELAYFECYHEMKMIVDLMYESGIHFMNYSISNTAEYGEYYAGPKVINEQSREAMREILARIQDGTFAEEFVADCKNGHAWLIEQREAINSHEIEKTGERIRGMFSWIHE